MLWLLMWTIYGLIVGLIAKALHRGEDPQGFLATIGIGIAGSYIGGFINFLIGKGNPFQTSGILMGIVGGVIFCYIYRKFNLKQYLELQSLKNEVKALKSQSVEDDE
jgi:uncharacterized membrane protein YeaQ/YmgE (transglycosylase-associated protein family)